MFEMSLEPVAVIATVQPMLLMWLVAIGFFVTVAVVAWLSRGRSWAQLFNLFIAIFVATSLSCVGAVQWLTSIDVVQIEIVSVSTEK
jgi:hypothetical protein